ncbi:MAG: SGNH/GDSL hydrolase family protein [bacterium]
MLLLTAGAALLAPIAAGVLIGGIIRRRLGRRISGAGAAAACLLLPAALSLVLTVRFPLIGLWDAATEGLLCGGGVLFAAHRLYAVRGSAWLTVGSVLFTLLVLEGATRLLLGPPPAYPIGDGPYFLLSDTLRTMAPDSRPFRMDGVPDFLARRALVGDLARPGEQTPPTERPPAAMMTTELVCAIVYGNAYHGVLDVSREPRVVFPARFTPRPEATRRVLHIGDSLVFGANVPRDTTFTAQLEGLEPGVQHINGGISGMAPDDYLLVLEQWIARHPIDLAVMYLFAGNDLSGLGAPHPCSNWQSILAYDGDTARLRFPTQPHNERQIGLWWMLANSPLPYLARALIVGHSAAAAYAGSGLAALTRQGSWGTSPEVQLQHLDAIVRTALAATRARHIPFVVVALPAAGALEDGPRGVDFAAEVLAIAASAGVPALDATPLIRAALARGDDPVQADRTHLNERGHALVAQWLHDELPAAAASAQP